MKYVASNNANDAHLGLRVCAQSQINDVDHSGDRVARHQGNL